MAWSLPLCCERFLLGDIMLSKEIVKMLNEQIAKEMYASNLYIGIGAWCFANRFNGAGTFLFDHAKEESNHAQKLIDYLIETDSTVELEEIAKPEINIKDILDAFEQTYAHELKITKSINDLVNFTLENKDFSTFNFLQWYVSEQHEEEALFRGIVDKIKLINDHGNGVFHVDQYIGTLGNK